jgi:hypothetical protein
MFSSRPCAPMQHDSGPVDTRLLNARALMVSRSWGAQSSVTTRARRIGRIEHAAAAGARAIRRDAADAADRGPVVAARLSDRSAVRRLARCHRTAVSRRVARGALPVVARVACAAVLRGAPAGHAGSAEARRSLTLACVLALGNGCAARESGRAAVRAEEHAAALLALAAAARVPVAAQHSGRAVAAGYHAHAGVVRRVVRQVGTGARQIIGVSLIDRNTEIAAGVVRTRQRGCTAPDQQHQRKIAHAKSSHAAHGRTLRHVAAVRPFSLSEAA